MTIQPGQQNPFGIQLFTVKTPSGSDLHLQTKEEADWYESRRDRYMADNLFPNISDLQDLDRLLMLEALIYRWGLWMAQGFDYIFSRVDENALKNSIKEYSQESRLLKASLGIDKATRNKEKSESVSDYIDTLLERAKIFGYHRNDQYELAVTKIYELRSMVTTHDRCDEEERRMLDLSPESVMEWIRTSLIPEWDALSASFRQTQAMWMKD